MVEEEITRSYSPGVTVMVPGAVALYILNQKRGSLSDLEQRRGVRIYLEADESLIPPDYRLERLKALAPGEEVQQRQLPPITVIEEEPDVEDDVEIDEDETEVEGEDGDETATGADKADGSGEGRGRGRRRRRRRGGRSERFRADEFTDSSDAPAVPEGTEPQPVAPTSLTAIDDGGADDEDDGQDDGGDEEGVEAGSDAADGDQPRRRRRRGRRGGRRRSRRPQDEGMPEDGEGALAQQDDGATAGEPTSVAGSGDQPSLPDVLPPHWQQHASGQMSFAVNPAEASVPDSSEAASDDAVTTTEPVAGDQANPRRRPRREEGERAPRIRKPRRSREEIAGGESAGEGEEGIVTVTPESPVAEVAHGNGATFATQNPATNLPDPAVQTSTHSHDRADQEPAVTPAVTIISDDTPAEEASKRRGWWRRLME
jgi:ribonuclease E